MSGSRNLRSKMVRLAGVAGVVLATSIPGAAFAEGVGKYGGGGNNGGGGTSTPTATVGGASGGGSSLPFTGGDVAGLALIGAGAVVGGVLLSRSGKRSARA